MPVTGSAAIPLEAVATPAGAGRQPVGAEPELRIELTGRERRPGQRHSRACDVGVVDTMSGRHVDFPQVARWAWTGVLALARQLI
jgi:hypothetical protein